MSRQNDIDGLEAEAPELLKKIKWILLYGLKNWKILLIALIFTCAYPIYLTVKEYNSSPQKVASLGSFQISFINQLSEYVTVSSPGEFYLHAPETPGMNMQVSSGLIALQFASNEHTLSIAPNAKATITAKILNESRLLQYLDAGEFFGLIIFSASPKPVRTEILFEREAFMNGIDFVIDDINEKQTKIRTIN